jgi:hypothetical protein
MIRPTMILRSYPLVKKTHVPTRSKFSVSKCFNIVSSERAFSFRKKAKAIKPIKFELPSSPSDADEVQEVSKRYFLVF